MTATRQIEAWYDETSDADAPLWCVSLCESDGEEIKCLSTHDDESEAIEAGKKSAAKRGISCLARGKHGNTSSL